MKTLNLKRKIEKYAGSNNDNDSVVYVPPSEHFLISVDNPISENFDLSINNYDNIFRLQTTSNAKNIVIDLPNFTNNYMCFIHLLHKGIEQKEIVLTGQSTNFINNTLK